MMRQTIVTTAVLLGLSVLSWAQSPPTISKAEDGVFEAFRTHPLVGMREAHGLAQQLDFYSALIRDPRFARDVGNVVMELGNAAYQETADRYVSGGYVPYTELRKVWADIVAWSPTMNVLGTINVYATIRAVNLTLPPDQRIKVWLGDPPVDWSKIKTGADLAPLQAQRESFPAALIEREILAKGKKALVIYGADHLRLGVGTDKDNLLARIVRKHPNAFFLVMPYPGYMTAACTSPLERHFRDTPLPALISPIRGTSWEGDIWHSGCAPAPPPSGMSAEKFDEGLRDYMLTGDALLYLGPRDRLMQSPRDPDIYLDLDFRAEIERRNQIRSGKPLGGNTARDNPSAPRPF